MMRNIVNIGCLIDVIAYVEDMHNLYKTIYVADRLSFEKTGNSITNSNYIISTGKIYSLEAVRLMSNPYQIQRYMEVAKKDYFENLSQSDIDCVDDAIRCPDMYDDDLCVEWIVEDVENDLILLI